MIGVGIAYSWIHAPQSLTPHSTPTSPFVQSALYHAGMPVTLHEALTLARHIGADMQVGIGVVAVV